MKVLLTGFGPFPGTPLNPTGPLVAQLVRRRRPRLTRIERFGHVFTTSYAAVDNDLRALIARHQPDVILMFGLAGRTPHLRIETRSLNAANLLFSDAAGRRAEGRRIRAGGPASFRGRAPFNAILTAARRARIAARLSCNAGNYVCNYLYWRALESQVSAVKSPPLVLFVHVPPVNRKPTPRLRVKRRAITHGHLVRAGEEILLALVGAARMRH
jgi:pyroglutamyl-peptidase